MNTQQLEKKIRKLGIDERRINIGGNGRYDGRLNLIQRQDEKWEVFLGEYNQKQGARVFDTESEATDFFLRAVKNSCDLLKETPKKRVKGNFSYYFVFGIFVFSALFGLFFVVTYIVTQEFDWLIWFFVGWTLFFGILAFCWLDEKRYRMFEMIMKPIFFLLVTLLMVVIAVVAVIYMVPKIFAGDEPVGNAIGLLLVEASSIMFIYIFIHFFLIDSFQDLFGPLKKRKNNQTVKKKKP